MSLFGAAKGFITGDYVEATQSVVNLIEGFKFFYETEVVVGIPEETNVGREGGNSNAGLLYQNEVGNPAQHIPPRPVLQPALAQAEVKAEIGELMMAAAEAALVYGDVEAATDYYEKAGMVGRDACKDYIMGGNLAPNAPYTIAKKGSSQPLVDTGSMFNSISYAVRKKK